jgi:hypothetical protein
MVDAKININDTIPLEATLPRDLTNTSVTLLLGKDNAEYDVEIVDEENGDVKIQLDDIDLDVGVHEIQWEIKYANDMVEIVPPNTDKLYIFD